MDEGRNYDIRTLWARGKPAVLTRHAERAMDAERPRLTTWNVERTLEEPDHDDGKTAIKWLRGRNIIVRYAEEPEAIYVLTVSATRSRLRP